VSKLVGFTELARELMATHKDVPAPVVNRAIVSAVRRILEYINVEYEFYLPVQAGVHEYDLDEILGEHLIVAHVLWVKHDDKCLPRSEDCTRSCIPSISFDDDGVLTFTPAPASDSVDGYRVRVAVNIPPTSCKLPRRLVTRHREILIAGANYVLASTPGIASFDQRNAQQYGAAVKAMIADAVGKKAHNGVKGFPIQKGERIL